MKKEVERLIEKSKNVIRINLSERYSIMKWKNLPLWFLLYYRFGRNYMPDEIYADRSLLKVYSKYKEMI